MLSGLYYLQSRYYDPELGRFINVDNVAYLGIGSNLAGFNLFAYCGNNPTTGYDPEGHFDWDTFFSGAGLISTGITAIAVVATIITCGAAAPLMVAVATVTAAAGAITVVNGTAEVVEAGTGYNVVRDGMFGGNEQAYEAYRDTVSTVAEVGTAICGTYYAAKGGNVCFVEGTPVQCEQGAVPIETVTAGMLVWSWDEETGDVALKKVVETYVNETEELVHVFVDGEEIITTPSHPFYSPVKGWTDAVQLRAGDILVLVNGEYVVVEKVQHEILEAPVTVYNFQVEDYHTYYVSDSAILVHNTCATQRGLQRQKAAGMTNKQPITAPSGNTRIPDYLNVGNKVMGEAKSVKYLTKSNQLMDMFKYADANGYKMFLKVERWTKISKPLQQAIQQYNVTINVF